MPTIDVQPAGFGPIALNHFSMKAMPDIPPIITS